jgi:hypothetical protein
MKITYKTGLFLILIFQLLSCKKPNKENTIEIKTEKKVFFKP